MKSRLPLHFSSLQLPSHWFRRSGRGEEGDSVFPATVNAAAWPVLPGDRPRQVAVTSSTVLEAALRLHEGLAEADDIGAALAWVRQSLGVAMGAQGSACLLPLPTRDGSVVLQAVDEGHWSGRAEAHACLDLGACATVRAGQAMPGDEEPEPLLRALAQAGVQFGDAGDADQASARWPWRAPGAGPVVVLPLTVKGRPDVVGLIEWHGVAHGVEAWLPVLASAARTLSQMLARRARGPATVAQEHALLSALTETLPISVLVLDAQTLQVQALNRHAEMELGVQRDTALGRPIGALLGPSAQATVLPKLREAAQRDTPLEHDVRWARVEGERLVNARHVGVRDEQGDVRWLICQWRDVTDRRHAERSLAESQMRFKELVESIEEGVFVSDPDRAALEYASARVLDMLGLPPDASLVAAEVLSRGVVPEDRGLLSAVADKERALQATDCRLRIQHPSRGLRWLRQRTQPRRLADGRVQVVGLLDDVTDEHERERQLQGARDAAEAASQAKSQFMATMSHEIRTPMNGILGMTELLLGTRLGEKQRRFAQAVYRSAENLLEIINDVLDVAKIEAGRLELAPTELNLRALVEDTLELLAPRAHEKGLELSFREAAGVPERVLADPLRLRQVLTNLVANAVKFTEQGEVNVELACTLLGRKPRTVQLEFSVRDTGIGIAPEEVPRLFHAFSQAHGGMARRYGGTGLGLAIARQLVELMGGRIAVESGPGRGSLFRFMIPVEDVTPEPPERPEQRDSLDMPRLRVLLVEDHPTSRQVLESMLREWGLDVTVALDGRQALQLLRGRRHAVEGFHLALVDWRMPGLDGIEFARAVMAERLQPDMQWVLLSSMSAPEDLRAARLAGYRRFVQKPVRKGELREALLGLTRPASPALPAPQLDSAVLVVEDNTVNQEVMSHMLARLGCSVRVASSAAEGLAALAASRYDVVLMDIQMPDMDGIQALQVLRRGPNSGEAWATAPEVPVIAVTANTLPGDASRLTDQGFDGYLPKPYRQSDLLKILLACQGEAWQSEFAPLEEAGDPVLPAQAISPPRSGAIVVDQIGDGLPILDPSRFAQLHGLEVGGQNQLFERVCRAFEQSLDRMSTQLNQSMAAGDAHSVGQVVHTLKSSSGHVGAARLAQLSAHLEACLRAGADLAALAAPLGRLQDEIRLAQRTLAARQVKLIPS